VRKGRLISEEERKTEYNNVKGMKEENDGKKVDQFGIYM